MDNQQYSSHLSVKSLAIAGAVLSGAYLFLLALLAGWGVRIMWVSQNLVEFLNATIYPGYAVGFWGAIIGLLYGLIDGAICGGLIAWLYNKFCGSNH